jgi:hypothetical protein
MASLISRERRPLWAALSILLVAALGGSLFLAGRARDRLVDEAAGEASALTQSALSPLLRPRDLRAPITGQRHAQVSGGIRAGVAAAGPVQGVTIWSASGRILYAEDQALEGKQDSSISDLLSKAAAGTTQSRVVSDTLEVYAPLRARSGGPVAVAQLDQPYGPVVADSASPVGIMVGLSLALLASLALFAASSRPQRQPDRVVYVPPRPTRKPTTEIPALSIGAADVVLPAPPAAKTVPEPAGTATPPAVTPAAVSDDLKGALEEAVRDAEARARKAEQDFWGLQAQYKQALEEMGVLEAQVKVRDASSSQAEEEVRALREQARDAAQRSEAAEVDNKALRERLALQRTQLDESQTQILTAHQRIAHLEAELAEIRAGYEQQRYQTRAAGFEVLHQLNEPEVPATDSSESEEVVVEANERAPRVIIGMPSSTPVAPAGPPAGSPPAPPGDAEPQTRPGA